MLSAMCQAPHSSNAIVALLAQLPGVLNTGDGDGRTVLHHAAATGKHALVEMLIKLGADVHVPDELGSQASHVAAAANQPAALAALICGAADLEARDEKRRTPLMVACAGGHKQCVKLLLQSGSKVFKQSQTDCVVESHVTVPMNVLLQVVAKDKTGSNPMHHAISGQTESHLDIINMLNERNETLIVMNNKIGHNAVHAAAEGGMIEIMDRILVLNDKAGEGKVNLQDKLGVSPLHLAAIGGHSDTIFLLLSKGAKANAVDQTGKSAMHWACSKSMCEAVQILTEQGEADANLKDKDGVTPLDIAKKKKDTKTIKCM